MAETLKHKFREAFTVSKELLRWYPGHMEKGMVKMQNQIRNVDCVLEVHDARVPFSGRNPNFVRKLLGIKPHILVLNKVDLVPKSDIKIITDKMKENGDSNVIFTDCLRHLTCPGIRKLVPTAIKLIYNSPRYHRVEERDLNMMVIGIPNVGKSSIINALRSKNIQRGKATRVGAVAGITTDVLFKIRVNYNPNVFLIDTPGILPPNIQNDEVGLKLALCSCLKDSNVTEYVIADFLLYWLNKSGEFDYVSEFNLIEPTDNIELVLNHIARSHDKYVKFKDITNNTIKQTADKNYAAKVMIKKFRNGKLGAINLDRNLIDSHFPLDRS